jgi:Leucine-rich repeat (LRR) protein
MSVNNKQRINYDHATSIVCSNNGISKQQFFSELHEIKSLEMCHFNLPSISITGMNQFKNLTSLCIVAQDIEEMTGIESLVHLEQLWVCETKITRICALEKLHSLEKLFLYLL